MYADDFFLCGHGLHCFSQTNARLGEYIGFDAWSIKTAEGATIQTAVDFTMTIEPGQDTAEELYPNVAAVGEFHSIVPSVELLK